MTLWLFFRCHLLPTICLPTTPLSLCLHHLNTEIHTRSSRWCFRGLILEVFFVLIEEVPEIDDSLGAQVVFRVAIPG